MHLTVHMGGGVGKAISDTLIGERKISADVHNIYCLERPVNEQYVKKCQESGIAVEYASFITDVSEAISNADIVILHWWNHPAMAKLLLNFPQIETRVVFWIHVSGCTYPKLPFSLINYMEHTIFTTPYTYQNPYWNKKEQEIARKKASVVYGLGQLKDIGKKEDYDLNGDFVIGYVGTINTMKIHPDIVLYCEEVKREIPNARFVFVGENQLDAENLDKMRKSGLLSCIEFTGHVKNVEIELKKFDVFGYPLNPYHYGSTENALLEPMAAGIPVVVLSHGAESYIVKNEFNGLLANDCHEYACCMKRLWQSKELRSKVGNNAAYTIRTEYNLDENIKRLNMILSKGRITASRKYDFCEVFGRAPEEYFLTCVGREREIFLNNLSRFNNYKLPDILRGSSKGSIQQFAKYFPENKTFNTWRDALNGVF
ncbi:MAG: glycosyl transferase group 1 [Firmicutes bacterium]|nr:glycosyl transferase group 1 [Bacillota bacterium]